MSASHYQQLVDLVLTQDHASLQPQLSPLYQDLNQAFKDARPGRKSQEEISYRFERLRLGIGILLMQLLMDLGGDEDSQEVRDLLQQALAAGNVAEIDKTIQQKSHLFEDLYTDLYVNTEAEAVLALFEATLHASSKEEADEIIVEALDLAQDLEFDQEDPDTHA
ncbi:MULTISPECIES: hypothetical protein [Rufibacter]|uniref:Uncharacterized protein n=1 Tax=Rufibacter quisquiliarum TaxID=1549639 RepID=A0A839GDZ5_9BACT|nr:MULTISPECIES: hypothetical protein [Rufibacter]MBA9075753.1 hypothetical protein [Rufibacter quisquiliarum]